MAKYRMIFILGIVIGLFSASVLNTTALVQEKDLKSLTEEADTIVSGKVLKQKSYWENGRIFTDIVISTNLHLKGEEKDKITVKVPGGTVGEITEIVSDTPSFEDDEEALVFVKGLNIVGWFQGKYTIKDDNVLETGESLAEFVHKIKENLPEPKKGKIKPTIDVAVETLNKESMTLIPVKVKNNISSIEQDINGETTIKYEGFEGAFPGEWELSGDPTWCNTSFKSYNGSWSGWCACGGSNGVSPDGNYPDYLNAWMVYGPFDLSDASDAFVTFKHWTKTEAGYDHFKYLASINDNQYYGISFSGYSKDWESVTFDLTDVYQLGDLRGQPQVWIAFKFDSDDSFTDNGTFIDEIYIKKITGGMPTIIDITPDFGPAKAADLNTDDAASDSTKVTISGSDFGSIQGSLKFWRVDTTYHDASIESWSDTQIVARVPGGVSSNDIKDGSGNVYALTSGDIASNNANFRVTYSYGGGRWPGNTVTYSVNPNTLDTEDELGAVQAAADTWNNAGANFSFVYNGLSSITQPEYDGENSIMWVVNDDTGSIATTYTYYLNSDPTEILENDIEFNDLKDWADYDVQTIATHEFGHWLNLRDFFGTEDIPKMMYGFGSAETIKRDLHQDDIDGIISIYGAGHPYPNDLHAFVRGPDNRLYYKSYDGSLWSGWTNLGGTLTSGPGAAALNEIKYVFVRGPENRTYYKSYDGTTWYGWYNLYGSATSDPDAASLNGMLYVFVRGPDDKLYYKKTSDGTSWSGWNSLGGTLTSGPGAAVFNGNMYVFVRGPENRTYYKSYDGTTWYGWFNLYGSATSSPDAAALTSGMYVFVRGPGDKLYYKKTSDGTSWSGWTSLGGTLTSGPGAAVFDGNMYVFVGGPDNRVYYKTTPDGSAWNGWYNLGGTATSDPDAV